MHSYSINSVYRDFRNHDCKWIFKVEFTIGEHTKGRAEIAYIHSFKGEGMFETLHIGIDNYKRIREKTFYHLSKNIRDDIVEHIRDDISDIDIIEKKIAKPHIYFHEHAFIKDEKIYEFIYSFGESNRKRMVVINMDKDEVKRHGRFEFSSRNIYSDESIFFSAWQEYVEEKIRNDSDLRIALLDL